VPKKNWSSFKWKKETIQTKKGGKISVKSSWEKKFAQLLDEDKNVLNFQYEPLCLRYNYKGKKRNYYPDFLVRMKDDRVLIYEVKPQSLISYGKNKPKAAAGRRFCRKMGWEYQIITENVLFN
jgi:hypothetical protein